METIRLPYTSENPDKGIYEVSIAEEWNLWKIPFSDTEWRFPLTIIHKPCLLKQGLIIVACHDFTIFKIRKKIVCFSCNKPAPEELAFNILMQLL